MTITRVYSRFKIYIKNRQSLVINEEFDYSKNSNEGNFSLKSNENTRIIMM